MTTVLRPLPVTAPGFYRMTAAEYHADPCDPLSLSRSVAETLINQSPLHAQYEHPKLGVHAGEDDSNDAMKLGSLIHDLVLGNGPVFAIGPYPDWRTKESKEFRDQSQALGMVPILQKLHDQGLLVAEAIASQMKHMEFGERFIACSKEVTAVWREGDAWLRSRMDGWDPETGIIFDLKTTTDASFGPLQRKVADYAFQAAYYTQGIERLCPDLAGRVRFIFAFCEVKPPYGISMAELDEAGLSIGRMQYERAVAAWQECLKDDAWPGYSRFVQGVQMPAWAIQSALYSQEVPV